MALGATIKETYTLPSMGKLYGVEFDPKVTLRSMTTEEEMKRLSPSDSDYRILCEIIDDCIEEKLPISSYDMVLGDFEFLLHKLVTVTYGSEYRMQAICPNCQSRVLTKVNLDNIEVHRFDADEIDKARAIELPVSKAKVTLAFQTPRSLDGIKEKTKDKRNRTKDQHTSFDFMYRTMSYISSINGKEASDETLEAILRKMSLKDIYFILDKGAELGRKVGLDNEVIAKCESCGYEFVTRFQYQPSFLRPINDR